MIVGMLTLSSLSFSPTATSLTSGIAQARRMSTINMAAIESIKARQIYDSRGNPTVEVDMVCDGVLSRASVPSGASTGAYEAVELRDGGDRHMGKAVMTAVNNVNDKIAPKLIGMDPTEQTAIDNLMNELESTRPVTSSYPVMPTMAQQTKTSRVAGFACDPYYVEYQQR